MHNRELFWLAELAFLVIGIFLEPVIKFSEESLIVMSFHNDLFFHDLKEGLICARFKHIDTTLVIREFKSRDLLAWQLSCVHFCCQCEDVMIELLLKLFVGVVYTHLLEWITTIIRLKAEDVKNSDLRQRLWVLTSLFPANRDSFVHFGDNLIKETWVDRFHQRVVDSKGFNSRIIHLYGLSGVLYGLFQQALREHIRFNL